MLDKDSIEDIMEFTSGINQIKVDEEERQNLHVQIEKIDQIETDQMVLSNKIEELLGNQLLHPAKNNIHINENVYQDLEVFHNYQFETQDTIFSKLNQCQTLFGQHFLKDTLQHPTKNIQLLTKRQNLIKILLKTPQLHSYLLSQIQNIKDKEGKILWFWQEHADIQTIYEMIYFNFYNLESVNNYINNNPTILQCVNCYKIFINPSLTLLIPLLTIIVPFVLIKLTGQKIPIKIFLTLLKQIFASILNSNVILSPKAKFITFLSTGIWIFFYLQSIYYSCSTAYYTNKIINVLHHKINQIANLIQTIINILQKLPESITSQLLHIPNSEKDNIIQYQDTIFQQEPGWFTNKGKILSSYHQLTSNLDSLVPYLKFIGEIDFYLGLSTLYQESNQGPYRYQWVEYLQSDGQEHPIVEMKGIWDPSLLGKKIVTNDLSLQHYRNIIITGPNAAGKSTYIKTLALNILLSQTIGLAAAKKMRLTPFQVINTYLNIPDCLGKSSLFEAEMYRAKEHLELITKLPKKEFAFVIMDELFSSTNYVEGFSAAYSVIKKLIQIPNSVSIITTHYTDLTRLEKDTRKTITKDGKHYRKYYVRNYQIPCLIQSDQTFQFPYRIKHGVCRQYIALEILKKNQFDPEIIQEALAISSKITTPKCV